MPGVDSLPVKVFRHSKLTAIYLLARKMPNKKISAKQEAINLDLNLK